MNFFTRTLAIVSCLAHPCKAAEDPEKILRFSSPMVSVSAVQGKHSLGAELIVGNHGDTPLVLAPKLIGKDAKAFSYEPEQLVLAAGESGKLKIWLSPIRGAGTYAASLDVSEGAIPIEGLGMKAFEGSNEPSLARIAKVLGIGIDVGNTELGMDTQEPTIGDSLAVNRFKGIAGEKIRITPVARFSPPGELPFGIALQGEKLVEWGRIDASAETRPDNHQCLFPLLKGGTESLEMEAPEKDFSLYLKGFQYVSFTDIGLHSAAEIKHTARVYPVETFQGRPMENAYLVGFEDARNGDYQDAVFLLENVTAE